MKFDLHCHTRAGSIDARVPLSRYIELLKIQGFAGLLVTDHDSYRGFRQWKEEAEAVAIGGAGMAGEPMAGGTDSPADDFVVLKGIEYDTSDAGHFLVIMPDDVHLDVLTIRGMSVETLVDLVHRYGGILGPAHPFGTKSSSLMYFKKIHRHPNLIRKFDFIEGFNTCESARSNYFAQKLAACWGKPCTGGSDSHVEDYIGMAYTEFDADVRCNDDLIAAIRGRKISGFGGEVRGESINAKLKDSFVGVWGFRTYNSFLGLMQARKRSRMISDICIINDIFLPSEFAAE